MNRISLEQRGTAKWFEVVGCDVSRPQKAVETSALEAVRFVMEQLRPEIRSSAWIDTTTGSLEIGDIQVIYPTIRACPRFVTGAAQPALVPGRSADTSTWDTKGGAQVPECRTRLYGAQQRSLGHQR